MIVTCGSDVCLHDTRVCLSFFPVLSILLHAPFVSIMFCFHHDRVRRRLQKALEDCTLSKDLQYVDLWQLGASWKWGGWSGADAICRSASQQINKHETLLKKDETGCTCWFWNYDNIPMLIYIYIYISDLWLPLFSQNPKDWVCAWLITPTKLMSHGGTLPCNFILGGFPWISFASVLHILLWFRVISGEVPGNFTNSPLIGWVESLLKKFTQQKASCSGWVWRCHVA